MSIYDIVFRNKTTNFVMRENIEDLSGENHFDLKSKYLQAQ